MDSFRQGPAEGWWERGVETLSPMEGRSFIILPILKGIKTLFNELVS
jgi:hypothetical protein